MITEIDDYFARGCGRCNRFDGPDCSVHSWAEPLAGLRAICRAAGLEEVVRWGHPCYRHADQNIALIGAFRTDVRLTFFHAALMKDPEKVLERPGPNSRQPNMIRFMASRHPVDMNDVLLAYLNEAKAMAEAGVRPPRHLSEIAVPADLLEALDDDPLLAEAFHRLTPGRQRSYVIQLSSSSNPVTRATRIERFRPKILDGKGALDR